ncbi:MAG: alpha-isopropylmalate synthase regulatory domain-containing protein [Balneolaceae bacterium]
MEKFFPEVTDVQLQDFKVRVLNEKDGTGAGVRVLIDSGKSGTSWSTVGVSQNIIDASWQALSDSMNYFLLNHSDQSVSDGNTSDSSRKQKNRENAYTE